MRIRRRSKANSDWEWIAKHTSWTPRERRLHFLRFRTEELQGPAFEAWAWIRWYALANNKEVTEADVERAKKISRRLRGLEECLRRLKKRRAGT